jgi:tRNA pseudouridine32 synthase / 23S rRNA pseudouridine746 synthase
MSKYPSKFINFKKEVHGIELPEKFTFPFYYEPHPLAIIASEELQDYLANELQVNHNFGLDATNDGYVIGKMFGVLVVQTVEGELGYLAAFSGKLANSNEHELFVPPVFDMLKVDGFYRQGERKLYEMNDVISALEQSEELKYLRQQAIEIETSCNEAMQQLKQSIKDSKEFRKQERERIAILPESEQEPLLKELEKQSIRQQYELKDLTKSNRQKKQEAQDALTAFLGNIQQLKRDRKAYSQHLQDQIFDQYHFYNANGETRSVLSLFENIENGNPPSGAGECAAPKLMQYAYLNNLKPVALAEFWWGASPASEIRKHQQYYPSCRGKCEPILGHMLQGLEVDDNPMLVNPAIGKELEIVYEDELIVVVNKPADFLSVPGKNIEDSVLSRMAAYLPMATGPLLVHRLDMSTSGILLVAKTKDAHAFLQRQFIRRTVDKRYVALLEGELSETSGFIDLPLRVDLDDRPRQLVCYDYGKSAQTKWELVEVKEGRSKVYFYPITGRTHQLRVHAAHSLGLNMPIVGDDLYGTRAERLHLHAESLSFYHPATRKRMSFQVKEEF